VIQTPQAQALQLADKLDRMLASSPDFMAEDVLGEISRLLDKDHATTFRAALTAHLAECGARVRDDHGRRWDLQQLYPNVWDAKLEDEAEEAENAAAADWRADAERLMRPFRHPAVEWAA
jgi:hypothetical protein